MPTAAQRRKHAAPKAQPAKRKYTRKAPVLEPIKVLPFEISFDGRQYGPYNGVTPLDAVRECEQDPDSYEFDDGDIIGVVCFKTGFAKQFRIGRDLSITPV